MNTTDSTFGAVLVLYPDKPEWRSVWVLKDGQMVCVPEPKVTSDIERKIGQ